MRFEERTSTAALARRFQDVRRRSQAAGSDGVKPEQYENGLEGRLSTLSAALRDETYRPSRLLRIGKDKPGGGMRRLAIPTVEDRIVIELLRDALEPAVESLLSPAAYAYRPGRSARAAADAVLAEIGRGASWVAVADIRDFFDTVPLERVIRAVMDVCDEPGIGKLTAIVLRAHALRPGLGLPQGSSLSPLLSNLLLTSLDRRLLAAGFTLIRYCDNLIVPTSSEASAKDALAAMRREAERLDLSLKPAASSVVEVRAGFLWLGFWMGPDGGKVSEGALQALRSRVDIAGRGLTGERLRARILPIVRGWLQYFDTPLPDGIALGVHDRLLRGLIDEHRKAQPQHAGQGISSAAIPSSPGELDESDGEPVIIRWDEPDESLSPVIPDRRSDVASLLKDADRLAAAGDYLGAEGAYETAQRLSRERPPEPEGPVDLAWDPEALDAFIGLLAAGQESFETAPPDGKTRREFKLVGRPLRGGDVRDHLAGRSAIAVRPRLPDGACTLAVIDIDGTQVGPPAQSAVPVAAYAEALASVARAWGWSVLVEETGGRGVHLWIPIDGRMPADEAARALFELERAAGAPAPGVRIERLPGGDAAPDLHQQAMTLPLGVHLETGRQSHLRWASGVTVERDLSGLFAGRANDPSLIRRVLGDEEELIVERPVPAALPVWTDFAPAVARIMEGCAVLRHLAEKAAATGHLNHGERLSLLYNFGHLGENGERVIHGIIGKCRNYDVAETTRQIARLGGLPIGCTRMREKHATPELLPLCACDFGDVRQRGGYPTPLLHAAGFRRSWRDLLRERRDGETRARAEGTEGVTSVVEEPLDLPIAAAGGAPRPSAGPAPDKSVATSTDEAEAPPGLPPHEWA